MVEMQKCKAQGDSQNPGNSFSIVQFNVLAQKMCTKEMFHFADEHILKWQHRQPLLSKALKEFDADIICLQEVQGTPSESDVGNHSKWFERQAGKLGYAFIYSQNIFADGSLNQRKFKKTRNYIPDLGAMMWYRKADFELLDSEVIKYAVELSSLCTTSEQKEHYCGVPRNQVALTATLRHRATDQVIIVVSTHIACAIQDRDIQLAQIGVLLSKLQRIRSQTIRKLCKTFRSHQEPLSDDIPVVICGDFNAQPSNGAIMLAKGTLPSDHPEITARNPEIADLLRSSGLLDQPSLKLLSAYEAVNGAEPDFTVLNPVFEGCIDYILATSDLMPLCVRPLPDRAELTKEGSDGGGIPSSTVPSDHVPLGAVFQLASLLPAERAASSPRSVATTSRHEPQ